MQGIALILGRRLVEIRIDELAGVVPAPHDFTSRLGLRFEWTLKTFMNTLIFSVSRFSQGS